MRHQSSTRHFNRDTNARKGLILSLVTNLATQGEIIVTKPMAKETQRHMDKLIVRAKKGDLASRRVLHAFFGKRSLVNLLVDQIAPAFPDRATGFTTISHFGIRRGDNADLYAVKLLAQPLARPARTESKFPVKAKKTAVPAKKVAPKKAAPKAAK